MGAVDSVIVELTEYLAAFGHDTEQGPTSEALRRLRAAAMQDILARDTLRRENRKLEHTIALLVQRAGGRVTIELSEFKEPAPVWSSFRKKDQAQLVLRT